MLWDLHLGSKEMLLPLYYSRLSLLYIGVPNNFELKYRKDNTTSARLGKRNTLPLCAKNTRGYFFDKRELFWGRRVSFLCMCSFYFSSDGPSIFLFAGLSSPELTIVNARCSAVLLCVLWSYCWKVPLLLYGIILESRRSPNGRASRPLESSGEEEAVFFVLSSISSSAFNQSLPLKLHYNKSYLVGRWT